MDSIAPKTEVRLFLVFVVAVFHREKVEDFALNVSQCLETPTYEKIEQNMFEYVRSKLQEISIFIKASKCQIYCIGLSNRQTKIKTDIDYSNCLMNIILISFSFNSTAFLAIKVYILYINSAITEFGIHIPMIFQLLWRKKFFFSFSLFQIYS